MKRFLLAALVLLSISSEAAHIKGGFFTYQYLGPGTGTNLRYRITLTVYMLCEAAQGTQVNDPISFSIFNPLTNQLIQNPSVAKAQEYQLGKAYDEPCITGNQIKCYYKIVIYDLASIELPSTPQGYLISYQRCCRIPGINNVVNSGGVGNTFTILIPGTAQMPGAETNSSPVFPVNDTIVICRNSYFQHSFEATDANGDSLSYSFCSAYQGGDAGANSAPNPAANPPYNIIPYQSPFSGAQPMGAGVTINPVTGLISGIAPDIPGQFVLCVCVNEYRNGEWIASTRKELHVDIGDCSPLDALLNPTQITCDGFNVDFANQAPNPAGTEFLWNFDDPLSGVNNISTLATPNHIFSDTGIYNVKLKVSMQGGLCADSTVMRVAVYPGFFPGFIVNGNCFSNPFSFTDTTNTRYGTVNSWSWNFGDLGTLADTSHIRNPAYTYPNPGTRTAQLIVTNSKGCVDTATVTINVLDKPPLSVPFRDTLICRNDQIVINATGGTGQFTWTGPQILSGANTSTATVSPVSTSWYFVNLNDLGCVNRDSVRVRVVNSVTLRAINDTTICQGDPIQLNAATDGLAFTWTPQANVSNPNILNPIAVTPNTTTYTIVATVGSCSATDQVVVTTVPYPRASLGPDQIVCYNGSIQLNASHDGSSFTWSPTSYLDNPGRLNPIASPPRTTTYIFSSFDTRGCPKPGRDTVVVTILPRVRAYAGRDTSVIVGQPLQLNGSGGVNYTWTPSTGLSNPNIANPIGIYTAANDTIKYKLVVADAANCLDSAFVVVRIFQTKATVFVPTAFTPNNDGKNDVVRPICVGIEKINYFSVYNRWGQLVFTTSVDRAGWDGRINGRLQDSGVFVWMVSAVDYSGNKYFQKGTVALIR